MTKPGKTPRIRNGIQPTRHDPEKHRATEVVRVACSCTDDGTPGSSAQSSQIVQVRARSRSALASCRTLAALRTLVRLISAGLDWTRFARPSLGSLASLALVGVASMLRIGQHIARQCATAHRATGGMPISRVRGIHISVPPGVCISWAAKRGSVVLLFM